MNYNIAVEMGTSNTVLYKLGVGVVLKEPTIVAVQKVGKKKVFKAAGCDAYNLIGKTKNIEFINPIKNGIIVNFEFAKTLMMEFLKKIQNKKFFNKTNIVFLIPCGLSDAEKRQFKNLAYSLDANNVELLPSIFAGLFKMKEVNLIDKPKLALSIGGGITDIAIISDSIISGITLNIGGIAIEKLIKDFVLENHNIEIIDKTAKEIEKEIGTLLPNDMITIKSWGVNISTKEINTFNISSQELFPIFFNIYSKIADAIEMILKASDNETIAQIKDNGLYVFGGCANITGLERFLRNRLNLPVVIDDDCEFTSIIGAGKLLANPENLKLILKNK